LKTHERVAFIVIQICALFNIRDPIVSAITPTAFRFPVDLIEPRYRLFAIIDIFGFERDVAKRARICPERRRKSMIARDAATNSRLE